MSFSDNLKRARKRVGLTQQQIADALGITKSTYCGYETGKRQPSIPKLRRLALLLCTSSDDLLGLNNGEPLCAVTPQEHEQVILFRQLDPHVQKLLRLFLEEEKKRIRMGPQEQPDKALQPLHVALQPVGCDEEDVYLGPDGFRTAYVRRSALPEGTVFGLRVCGAGLEPRYHNGDVLIISGDRPEPGQAGVFLRGWQGAIHLMGYGELLSIDPARPSIPLYDGIRPCGTVIGTLSQADLLE